MANHRPRCGLVLDNDYQIHLRFKGKTVPQRLKPLIFLLGSARLKPCP